MLGGEGWRVGREKENRNARSFRTFVLLRRAANAKMAAHSTDAVSSVAYLSVH